MLQSWFDVAGEFAGLFGTPLLLLSAICIDGLRQIRHAREKSQPAHRGASEQDWVPAVTTETHLEAELIKDVLDHAGIAAIVRDNRAIPIVGTLALWEASRPTFPSLTIHRRLGGGQVTVLVPGSESETAGEALSGAGVESQGLK